MLDFFRQFIPAPVFHFFQPYYHWSLAFLGALLYRFPSRQIKIIGITGTKGKSTVAELTSTLLTAAGYYTALVSTVHFKINDQEWPNLFKMTTPGRFFLQRFLRQAVNAHCQYVVLELSSEAAKLYRHAFINLDALIFTNLSPEHIESHGSYEKYLAAKLSLVHALERSPKKEKVLVVNNDDTEAGKFLAFAIPKKITYSLAEAKPYETTEDGSHFTFNGEMINAPLPGLFNIYNMLAAAEYAKTQGASTETIKKTLEKFSGTAGRMQKVYASQHKEKQNFDLVVDYAHTAASLEAAYGVYAGKRRIIAVFGSTGGGRDKWKRPAMGQVADKYCAEIILTNDDPYEENPEQITTEIGKGITKKYRVIIDRRLAIREAIKQAGAGDVIMLTGKGTDPYLMEAGNKKTPWSDARIAQEEIDLRLANLQ